jgi:ubiquinone/menaquinone biosynthesis C-methylase UbiE
MNPALPNKWTKYKVRKGRVKNIFDHYYQKYDTWYDTHKFAYLSELEAIKKVLPKKGKGLEIGVGTGRFAAPLGIKYGIDPSKKMLEITRKRGVEVKLGHGEKLPFANASFNYVAIIITLCFTKDPLKVLSEAGRVLKKNGKVIIGIIDKDSFLGKFYQKKKSIFYKQANFFGIPELVGLLKATGFNRISYYQTIYKLPDKIKSVQKTREGFGRGGFVVIGTYKSRQSKTRIYRKFRQYERIRLLFKRYGYDMDAARQKVFKRAGKIFEPILDVGTGPGRMAYILAKASFNVTTIDI